MYEQKPALRRSGKRGGAALLLVLSAATAISVQAANPVDSDYRQPDAEITALLTAATPPEPLLHASTRQVALLYREPVISMARLARPRLGLAGFRFDPVSQTSGVVPLISRVEVLSTTADAQQQPLVWEPPAGAVLDDVRFSPDGRTLSAVAIGDGPARLVLFDVASATPRVLDTPIHAAWGSPCDWVGSDELLCRVTPGKRGTVPGTRPAPTVVEHDGGPLPMRTYQNLLENNYEDALFDYYFSAGLARVDRTGAMHRIPGVEGLLRIVEPSPDGGYALVTRVQRPYPRVVPARRFPSVVEVWDLTSGQRLYRSAASGFGIDGDEDARVDPRRAVWMPATANAGTHRLGYIETSKGSDGEVYHWMSLSAPFTAEPVEVAVSAKPFRRFGWTSVGTPYFTTQGETAEEVSYQVVRNGKAEPIWKGVVADRYDNPGRAIRTNGSDGPVLEADGRIFIAGDGLSDAGPRPFLDALDLAQGETRRVFEAQPGVYEIILGILDTKTLEFVTSRETETEPPNLYLHRGDSRTVLSHVPDPFPQLAKTTRRVVSYQRADGVALSGTLYLPENYREGQRLPTLVWIYPTEFDDREQAEQMDLRFFRFHKVKGPSPLAAVAGGYAVLLNPTVPIVYDGSETSDDYLPQLISSVEAAVKFLIDSGISEPGRLAVAGRSYGAFATANLLVHTELFAAGIAMSGAYNRTLTPFGFQHEHRSFWAATEYYASISPFYFADQLKAPILLVHGGSDENAGTITFGARRYFHALLGAGEQARYVELPYEGHHYWGRENVLLASAEMLMWLDRFIGRPPTP